MARSGKPTKSADNNESPAEVQESDTSSGESVVPGTDEGNGEDSDLFNGQDVNNPDLDNSPKRYVETRTVKGKGNQSEHNRIKSTKVQKELDSNKERPQMEKKENKRKRLVEPKDSLSIEPKIKKSRTKTKSMEKVKLKSKKEINLLQNEIDELKNQVHKMSKKLKNKSLSTQIKGKRREVKEQKSAKKISSESDTSDTTSSTESSDSSESQEDSDAPESPILQHLSNVSGGSSFQTSLDVPLHSFVDKKIKKKVWKFKFIELASLLDKEEQPKKGKWSLEIMDSTVQKVFSNEHNQIQSWNRWDKAFNIFISIHLNNPKLKSVQLIDSLLSYRQTILEIMRQGGNWSSYDRKFRKYISNLKRPIFGQRMPDLFMQCLNDKQKSNFQTKSKPQRFQNYQKKGFCIKFNKFQCFDKSCKYLHACTECKSMQHGAAKCNTTEGTKKVGNASKP